MVGVLDDQDPRHSVELCQLLGQHFRLPPGRKFWNPLITDESHGIQIRSYLLSLVRFPSGSAWGTRRSKSVPSTGHPSREDVESLSIPHRLRTPAGVYPMKKPGFAESYGSLPPPPPLPPKAHTRKCRRFFESGTIGARLPLEKILCIRSRLGVRGIWTVTLSVETKLEHMISWTKRLSLHGEKQYLTIFSSYMLPMAWRAQMNLLDHELHGSLTLIPKHNHDLKPGARTHHDAYSARL